MEGKKLLQWLSDAQKLHQRGQLDAAQREYERILQKAPDFGRARIALGIVLLVKGRPQDAVTEARRGMKDLRQPDAGDWINYGNLLQAAGQIEEACSAYEEARTLAPGKTVLKANLATLYMRQGRTDDAERLCRELVSCEYADPLLLLAKIVLARGEREEGERLLERAADIDPKHAEVPAVRAALALQDRDFKAAGGFALDALERNGNIQQAWHCLEKMDIADLPLDRLEQVLLQLADRQIQLPDILSRAVKFCRDNLIWKPLATLERQLARSLAAPLRQPVTSSAGFSLLSCHVPQSAHRHAAEALWRRLTERCQPLPPRSLPPLEEAAPLRVGFLSSDLRGHAIGFLIVGLLEKLRHKSIRWHLYSASFSDSSSARQRLFAAADRFINVGGLSDEELARRIRNDRIDILIDLNGMTLDTRACVLAYRPAPIQITWLGMPGTLGASLDDIQYILGDPWGTPLSLADGFSEKILQLPRSYQPNDHVPPDLSLAGTRAEYGLPEEAPVFCCFNQYRKFSPETFDLWAQILHEVPEAVLWLLPPKSDTLYARLKAVCTERGLEPSRIVIAPRKPQAQHIARISLADLVLDTLPYNAHTTCSDALRAGVPVVTLPGETFAGRVAASILSCADLPEWIAGDGDDYVRKAVDFARRPFEERQRYKARLREKYHAGPMMDNVAFARYFEQLCLGLYARHAAGLPPEHLRLTPDGDLVPLTEEADAVAVFREAREKAAGARPGDAADAESQGAGKTAAETAAQPQQAREAAATPENVGHIALPTGRKPLLVAAGAAADCRGRTTYEVLCGAGKARALLLEPDADVCALLRKKLVDGLTLLPGGPHDGGKQVLHICRSRAMNSFLEPDDDYLKLFPGFSSWGEVLERREMETVRLDDVTQAADLSFLKLGLQGGELTVLQHGEQALRRAVVVQLQLSPTPLYRGGSSLSGVSAWLEKRGWMLYAFRALNQRQLKPHGTDDAPDRRGSCCLQAEAVFIPAFRRWNELDELQLGELAFWAHEMLYAGDLTERALESLDLRDQGDRLERYRALPKDSSLMTARGTAPHILPR